MDTKAEILDLAVDHYKREFAGLSALDIAEKLGLPHDQAIAYLNALRVDGKGVLRGPVKLEQMSIDVEQGATQFREVETVMFFPTRQVLRDRFDRERKDYGPFLNQLHLGASQVSLRYFEPSVLRKYVDEQEKYHFQDDVVEGWIAIRDEYYQALPPNKRNVETFGQVRYGKRRVTGGQQVVAAILCDLADLPVKEQLYWKSFEIEEPAFGERDEEFETFVRGNFNAEFVDHEDAIEKVYQGIRIVNAVLAPQKLFRRQGPNPHLVYPVINSRKAYSAAHKELWKLLGPDSLDKQVIEDLLKRQPPELGQDLPNGTWALFKRLIRHLSGTRFKALLEPFERIAKQRSLDAHEIDPLTLGSDDYVERFKDDCLDIARSLVSMAEYLRALIDPGLSEKEQAHA